MALSCPHCMAPLAMTSLARAHGNVLACVWCASLVRLEGATVTVEKVVADDVAATIRRLVVAGNVEAATAEAEKAGLPPTLVREATQQIVNRTLAFQPLNVLGFGFFALWIGAGALFAYLAATEMPFLWVAVIVCALALLAMIGPLVVTVRALFGTKATATFKRVKPLGSRALRRQTVHVMASTIEVVPSDGSAPFEATFLAAVREQSVPRVVPGARIEVRYSKADPSFIRFHAWPA